MKQLLCTAPDGLEYSGCCNRGDMQYVLAALGWDVEVGEDINVWTEGDAIVHIDDDGSFTSNIDLGPVLAMTHKEAVEFVTASEWGRAMEQMVA